MAGSINLSRSTVVGDLFHNVVTHPRGPTVPMKWPKPQQSQEKERQGDEPPGRYMGAPTRPCMQRCHGRILLYLSGSACLLELTVGCSTNQKADITVLRTSVQRAVCQ